MFEHWNYQNLAMSLFRWPLEVLTCRGARVKQEREQFVYRLTTGGQAEDEESKSFIH